ncbi:integrase core domain-containing protein [Polyangium spumosum]|uniref:DDE-type integrase/transposase/recombinase n=1 Tax=Polyangium spumosum TaxID=889282 RepID=A0A6N7QCP4_9BACT|nr:integrase core domain-containing protein [Polyangium spumosum]MRG98661.1 DDE-type integrase/transposase/recombinase [Polyangium spumosum]
MPWRESRVVEERMRFIVAVDEDDEPFTELCRRFGISRKTGYKWLERYESLGPAGLEDKPPVARNHPHRLDDELADLFVQVRKDHPTWGPKKLRAFVADRHPELVVPAASTIGEILKSRGLIRPRRRRLRVPLHMGPLSISDGPNSTWGADFKGHFALGNRQRCHPLTVSDDYSRYLLACEGMCDPKGEPVRCHFERVFREFGMPERIRTDSGAPFASQAPGGLSALSVWWIKLGITPERIEPGRPEQNGRHERMHRTLKAEATQPPCQTMPEQQRVFDRFRHEYNDIRPHEAHGQRPPAKVYVTSARGYPEKPRSPEYGDEFIVRKVDDRGRLIRRGVIYPLTRLISLEPVGLREIDDGRWEVFYGPVLLGMLDETGKEPRFMRAG